MMAKNNFGKNSQTNNKLLNMPVRHQKHLAEQIVDDDEVVADEELGNESEETVSEEGNENEEIENNEEVSEDNPFDQNFDSIPDETTESNKPKSSSSVKEKVSQAKSKAEKLKNAPEKLKKGAAATKKTAAATVKTVKTVGTFIVTHPVAFLIILVVLIIFIIAILWSCGYLDGKKGGDYAGIIGASCTYQIDGEEVGNLSVEIINCKATKDNYQVIETVPFEKYVAGVALAEMGENYEEEAMKAQLIAVRSYTLSRNKESDVSGYNKKDKVIRMRNCEQDQVYWDYTTDSYRQANAVSANPSVSLYSPEYKKTSDSETAWKTALSEEAKTKYEGIVSSVLGKYAVDNSDNTVYTSYVDTTSDKFTELAKTNANTTNGTYTAILMQVYPQIANFKSPDCAFTYFGTSGEYSTWKQSCSLGATEWCNDRLGLGSGTTIDKIGCLVVSISMQIAHSKAAVTIENFNPGTFAKAIKYWGAFSSSGSLDFPETITSVVPSFKKVNSVPLTGSKASKISTIKNYAEQGYYIVIQAKGGGEDGSHFVALDVASSAATNWTTIKIWNPSRTGTDLFEDYGNRPSSIVLYQI